MSDRISSPFTGLAGGRDHRTGLTPCGEYRIADVDALRPFLVSVVSSSDLWMYLSSAGALTAGRANEDRALFPYETDDKLHAHAGVSGPITLLRVNVGGNGRAPVLWKPFDRRATPGVRRSMTKSVLSNRVTFEEHHEQLALTFRYAWEASDEFGWVRTCELEADEHRSVQVELLDGVINLLPAHAELSLQRASSCLINAYTQCELDVPSALAIYSLTSRITDKAEPSEALHANIAFHSGLPDPRRLLSTDQLDAFLNGGVISDEHLLTGRRGAFLVVSAFELGHGERQRWRIVLDAHRTQSQVVHLQAALSSLSADDLNARIDRSLRAGEVKLQALVAGADAQQRTADAVASAHHASNVLFNCLRGGAFVDNDLLPSADFARAVAARNRAVAATHDAWLRGLPATIGYGELLSAAAGRRDPQLLRLAMEYLPLTFGRRHGDPSRPWNRFDIRVTNEDGTPALSYQGNWRDIFQNWEALVESYPVFVESTIAKFVNASTVDGFNPYRITRDGIEWEVPDPHDPWSHIGYWGDHQVIYLLKLLEASKRTHPGAIESLMAQQLFAYADVPYRLRPYAAMLENRRETIDFDWPRHREIESRLPEVGSDARLVRTAGGNVMQVTLAEKLLVVALARLSNLVPGLGIWINAQRPEWNDANNALVGNGVSVVTLAYLRRYCAFCLEVFASREAFQIRSDVAGWLDAIARILADTAPATASRDRGARRAMLDQLGGAFERYRTAAYDAPSTTSVALNREKVLAFFNSALRHIDESLTLNRRRDGLYHAYNLLHVSDGAIDGEHLPPMLEGQVAILSSGLLSPGDAADLVEKMFASPLWREDQQSFMLYPIRELPGFLQKNAVDEMTAMRSAFARRLLQSGDRSILHRDETGQIRFNGAFRNARDVAAALDLLQRRPEWSDAAGAADILDLYERTFRHHGFTGRSGTMYGYEGIGCIYWHMVAKLLLAVQENLFRARDAGAPADTVDRLASLYLRVRAGLGFNKLPESYGAFPLDAYSHTPLHAGAQQPGMTGQVKEEILTRHGELGVRVIEGQVRFAPVLLSESELLQAPAEWRVLGIDGTARTIELPAGTLGFTFAGTPIIYRAVESESPSIAITSSEGDALTLVGLTLGTEESRSLLARDGSIARIEVSIPRHALRRASPTRSALASLGTSVGRSIVEEHEA